MSIRSLVLAFAIVLFPASALAVPVRDIADLESITFWERTGGTGPTAYTFALDGPELTTLLADPLGALNNDISGATSEYYDVYYSDPFGVFDLDGEYVTISGVFDFGLPNGGGLNLAEMELNFAGGLEGEFGNYVASFEAYGDNAFPDFVGRAIDGDLLTHTVMGNTSETDARLRVTLGFLSSSGPPPAIVPLPASVLMMLGALTLLGAMRRRSQRR